MEAKSFLIVWLPHEREHRAVRMPCAGPWRLKEVEHACGFLTGHCKADKPDGKGRRPPLALLTFYDCAPEDLHLAAPVPADPSFWFREHHVYSVRMTRIERRH